MREVKVALQHVDGILLEGEDSRIVKHAQKSNNPEAAVGENLSKVGNLEWVVFLFCFTSLRIKFLVHEEVDDEHDQGDAKQHHAELDGVGDLDLTTQLGEEG